MSTKCIATSVPYAEEWLFAFTSFLRSEMLNPVFKTITLLGEEYFFLGIIVLCLHFTHRKSAMQLAFLVVGVGLLNSWLKGWFQECRPSTVEHLINATGFSFPSGHAQIGAAFWGFLMWKSVYRWQRIVLFSIILLVAISRPYLGVHYLHDVGLGVVLGLLLSWIFHRWGDLILESASKTVVLLIVSFALSFLNPEESFKIFGALSGLLLGWQASLRFKLPSKLYGRDRLLSLACSGVAVLLWGGLKILFVRLSIESPFLAMRRYFFLCLCLSFLSPYLATRFSHLKAH